MRTISYEAIAAKAYERFLARGGQHGFDREDWLAAEAELRSREAGWRVVLVDLGPNKIEVVRALRELTSLPLAEVRAAVEALPAAVHPVASPEEGSAARRALEAAGAKVEIVRAIA